jgi:beta-glucosidase
VENTGELAGDETVEFYVIPKAKLGAPIRWLVGFEKAHLLPGESRTVRLVIDPRQLSLVDGDGSRSVQSGEYELYVGGNQPSAQSGIFLPFHIEGSSRMDP